MHSGGVWEGPWSLVSVTRMITPWMDQSHGMGPQMTLGGVEHCAVMCLVAQLYPTLCDPVDCSPPISSVHGDSPGKNASGLLCPPPGDHPTPGTEPRSPTLQADSLLSEPPGKPPILCTEHLLCAGHCAGAGLSDEDMCYGSAFVGSGCSRNRILMSAALPMMS